jgi:FKBP-type peptidyl-prolyl cis-trans isomerase
MKFQARHLPLLCSGLATLFAGSVWSDPPRAITPAAATSASPLSTRDAASADNAAAAQKFLKKNAKVKGVTTTASGLQYRILQPGDQSAPSPRPTDLVSVRYRGTFLDGTEFDGSERHSGAAPLAVNNLMKGWQEALVLMKPGSKWQLFVPPELGYGMGARRNVPGGSLLIFEIELMSVKPPPVPPQTQ